jgi:MFS family permease
MILLASLGGALELYDFVVFGVFASAIGAAFFPAANPLVSQMLAYAGFAIGYFARPVGGIVLGHFGDRVGRRTVFVGSMLVVSVVTLVMGLLPTYTQWGAAAPLLLLALRLVQGFCLGGELPGAITYAAETAPQRASLACGMVFACVGAGALLATLVNLGVQELLPPAALPGWGWRIGFLVGGLLGLVGCGVLHYDPGRVAVALIIGNAALSFGVLAVAWLGDHVLRRHLLAFGAALLLVGCWPWYVAAAERSVPLIVLLVLAAAGASFATGVFGAMVADLFPTRVRYSGVALVYNVSFTAFGGTAPLLATVAISATGAATAPALVMAGCAALTLLGSLWIVQHGGQVETSSISLPLDLG